MLKKEAYIVLLVLFSSLAYAEISDSIGLGETKSYMTSGQDITIYLSSISPFTEKNSLIINGMQFDLLLFQKVEIGNISFRLINTGGTSLDDYTASFLISDNIPFECVSKCEDNFIVDLVRKLDEGFELCKKNCTVGCGLYNEKLCINNDIWIIDNCGNKVKLDRKCRADCISAECTNCGDGVCNGPENYFNCEDCSTPPDFCISDIDCANGVCAYGRCAASMDIYGDGVCFLPQEDCSSPDCSCSNKDINSMGKDDNPVIIIHGFASSPKKLRKLQRALSDNLGYINGGHISAFDVDCRSNEKNSVYIASYYESENKVTTSGKLPSIIRSSYEKMFAEAKESTFTNTFSQLIEKVRSCSGSDKVNIIAHSMGGLIVRNYLLDANNRGKVSKVILLGTPLQGDIYGEQTYKLIQGLEKPLGDRKQLLSQCSSATIPSLVISLIDGRDVSGECQQLQDAGSISNPVLDIDETPGLLEYYTIAGNVDGKGDKVVTTESASLEGAVFNQIVDCDHFSLKDPARCKESYSYIVTALGYDSSAIKQRTFIGWVKEITLSAGDFFLALME